MNFYDALQLDPSVLKRNISRCSTCREKLFYWIAMAVRSVLIVAFAVLFISVLSGLFGQENTPLAVVLFCILLGIRFVNFEYCIGDSMVNLAAVFGILLFIPVAASAVPPLAAAVFHFAGFFTLLYITSQRPEYGNGGLYSFAYVYLSGNPVYGYALEERAALAFVGYILCAAVLYRKHRNAHSDIRFRQVIRRFDLHNQVHLWQLRMAVGVSLILAAGRLFDVERFMWMGFRLCIPVVRVSLLRRCFFPFAAAYYRCIDRFRSFFCFISDNSGKFSYIYGTAGRPLSGFLYRLSV